MLHQTDFNQISEIAEKQEINNLKNYTPFKPAGLIICGFLEYVNDNGREFNYRAIGNGSVECILSIGGVVTSTSGRIDMRNGDTYKVTVRPGQVHGWVCW